MEGETDWTIAHEDEITQPDGETVEEGDNKRDSDYRGKSFQFEVNRGIRFEGNE